MYGVMSLILFLKEECWMMFFSSFLHQQFIKTNNKVSEKL